jgi:hypothetical protein
LVSWRRIVVALGLGVVLALLVPEIAGAASDVWSNVGPSPQLSGDGLAGRYPLTNYSLDQHFTAVEVGLTDVDTSGLLPMIAYFFASVLWLITSFLANLLITVFSFAFGLDLVNGSAATGGEGALAPVSRGIHSIYAEVLGEPWLVLAVAVAGIWAMWKALVQRRYSETAGALGLSLIYVVCALFFVAQPGATIGSVSGWTNQMSGAFLSISSHGTPSGARQAKEDAGEQLFDLLVFKPWVVVNFGGLEHCVRAGTGDEDSDPVSVPVRPLSSNPARDATLARRLQAGTEITADNKVCVNNANKYAPRFLRYGLGTPDKDERDKEYEALNDGDASELPDARRSGYRLGVADKPATDAMEQDGQYQRLLLALVLFVGELGAFLLLGALSIGVILAQVLLLLLLAFSPVALIAAVIPGRGHDFFKGWLEKLAGYLLRKAAYSLILAILLAVNGALAGATAQLGWLMSFGFQSLFFWAVFLQRRALTDSLIGIATGPKAPGRDASLKLLSIYAGGRVAGRLAGPMRRKGRSLMGRSDRALGGIGPGSEGPDRPRRPRRAPLFGTSYSAPVGQGAPPLDAPSAAESSAASPSATAHRATPGKTSKGSGPRTKSGRRDAGTGGASGGARGDGESAGGGAGKGAHRRTDPRGDERNGSPPKRAREPRQGREPSSSRAASVNAPNPSGTLQAPERSVIRNSSSAEGRDADLGAELRAEAARSREAAGRKKPAGPDRPQPRRAAAVPRWRRRLRRKGRNR